MAERKYLPHLYPEDGLSLDEIILLTKNIPGESWGDLRLPISGIGKYSPPDICEGKWNPFYEHFVNTDFTYRYHSKFENMDFYLADHLHCFREKVTIKIMEGDLPIGYPGKIRRKNNHFLDNLVRNIRAHCSQVQEMQREEAYNLQNNIEEQRQKKLREVRDKLKW